MRGRDVVAYKRGLRKAGFRSVKYLNPPVFGPLMKEEVKHFQAAHHLQADGIIGPVTYHALYPYIDRFGRWLLAHTKRPVVLNIRQKIVAECQWGINHHADIHWAEWRPMPLARWKAHLLPITTDCSGSYTCVSFAAGAPDPNGLNYGGEGSTGTMLNHMKQITYSELQIGDAVVYGAYPGLHTVTIMELGADPLVFTLGHEGTPDDPRALPLSAFTSYFAGHPVSYLSVGV